MDVSIVIPSNRSEVLTVNSIPEGFDDVQIRRDRGLNRARNAGVENAEHRWIVIADDDLEFDPDWFRSRLQQCTLESTVYAAAGTGIFTQVDWPEGFQPGLGRMMIFSVDAWRDAGGFPTPCSHGGDTDFLMSAFEVGYRVEVFPHRWEHRDEDDEYSFHDNLSWLWFLFRRHPRLIGPRLPTIAFRKVTG